jgi:hypothetical protein
MQFITVSPPTPITPEPPVLTRYQQIATELFGDLQTIRGKLPELEAPHPETKAFVDSMRRIPRSFVDTMVGQVQQVPEYQSANRLDVQNALSSLQLVDGLRPFVDALRTLLTVVENTVDVNYARVANSALELYQIAKGLARGLNSPHIATSVEILSEALGRKGIGGHPAPKQQPNTGSIPPSFPAPAHTTTMLVDDGIVITGKVSKMEH